MRVFPVSAVCGWTLGLWISVAVAAGGDFEVIATMDVGANPHGMRIEGDIAYLAMAGDDAIAVIDLKTMTIARRWPVAGTPLDLIRGAGGWLVSAFRKDYLIELKGPDGSPGASWPVGKGPSLFAPRSVGGIAYIVSEFADRLTLFDTVANRIVATYATGKQPYPGDVTRDGVLAFVPNKAEDTVSVIDLLNGRELARALVCDEPMGGALTTDDVYYLVACGGSDEVAFVNTASLKVTARITEGLGPRPFSVAVSDDGLWAFANNSGGDTVSVIDLAAGRVIERVTVGATPIVMRTWGQRLYVASEGSNTLAVIAIPKPARPVAGDKKNEIIVLGMIHGEFRTSERYSLGLLRALIREIRPDYVLTEIPPNRFDAAISGFRETGAITESRVKVFPEYTDVLFPLSREMDFEIIPTAGWNSQMAAYRRAALARIRADPARADEWAEYSAALAAMNKAIGGRDDDPRFIHTDDYDALIRAGWGTYDRLFDDELGTGGWSTINGAHYALIATALDAHSGEGGRFLITYGAAHKSWFLDQLRQRDDITLRDVAPFLDRVGAQ